MAGARLPARAVLRRTEDPVRGRARRGGRGGQAPRLGLEAEVAGRRHAGRGALMSTVSRARQPAIGSVAVLGAHILDVLGRPVESIPPGQGSARLTEIRATAAGTAAGTGVDPPQLGAGVPAIRATRGDPLRGLLTAAVGPPGARTRGPLAQQGGPALGAVPPPPAH